MKVITKIFGVLLGALALTGCNTQTAATGQVLFHTPDSDTIPYRIPAMAAMHNGDILALTDYRLCGNDIGYGRVDIHGRISRNGGRT